MAHSYAEATRVTSNSPAYGEPGWPREDVTECGDSIGGCNWQTEPFDRGGGSLSDNGATTGHSKLVERHANSPACWETGMKRKDIVTFGDNTIVRGCDGQVDASDSGVGGSGSYGDPRPIKPCKPEGYHGKTHTSIHRLGDEFKSALGIDIGAETVRDSLGQDEASDSGVGGVSSCGGTKPPPTDGTRPYPKPVSRAGPLNRSAKNRRHNIKFTVGFDIEDEAFESGEGGTTGEGVNHPRPPARPKRVRKYLHSTHLKGDPDIQTGACDSGEGGGCSGRDPPIGPDDSDVGYLDRTTSFSRKVGGFSGRSSALNVPKPTKRQGNIEFGREIRSIREIIEQDQYDADAELSDEYDGNGSR